MWCRQLGSPPRVGPGCCAESWVQGGEQGWFRSMEYPRRGFGRNKGAGPRGIFRHLDALKGHNFFGTNSRIIRQFLIILEYFSLKVTFGKDEVPGSNPGSSSTITALFVEKRAVLLHLWNFIVVIKHAGWRLTTHSATDRKTRPLEFVLQRPCCILAHFLFLFQPFFFTGDLRIHLLD